MSRRSGKNANFSFDGLAIEGELNSIAQNIDNTLTEVTAFADSGAEFVEGLMNVKHSLAGACDFDVNKGDNKLFGVIGYGERAYIFQPTGNTDGVNDPNYKGNALVSSYSITAEVGGATTYTADIQTNGVVDRDVTA